MPSASHELLRELEPPAFLDSGAIFRVKRSDGFIPRDEAIAIEMPCKDYDRFIEVTLAVFGDSFSATETVRLS